MSFISRLKQQTIGSYWLSLGSVPLAEFAADAGIEAVIFDGQHGLWERRNLEQAIGIVKDRTTPLVRVAECNRFHISSALDAGAEGIIIPLIETAEQAEQAIEWSRFPPKGSRSGGGIRPLRDFSSYKKSADEHTFVALMIETKKGAQNLADILAVKDIDMIFIGTGDLSLSLGVSANSPLLLQTIDHIKQSCNDSQIPVGIFTENLDQAMHRRAEGYRLVVIGNDITTNRNLMTEYASSFTQ
ncbi:MAG: hypothetical protein JKY45_02275 [Emcibacter sp.]|nr:hypothetical protein [Emcibacter sp.]